MATAGTTTTTACRRRAAAVITAAVLLGVLPAPTHAAFPGRPGRIAYSVFDGSEPAVFTVNPDGSGRRRLTAGSEPAWSSDGRRIAYVTDAGVHVMRADGSRKRRIHRANEAGSPSWSPNGRRIVFHKQTRRGYAIFTIAADGSGVTRVAAGSGPAWSPTGDRIAFSDGVNLFTMTTDGRRQRKLTANDPNFSTAAIQPDWSPDGRRIAYVQGGSACSLTVTIMRADGSGKRPVPYEGCNMYGPAWSPDGTRLLFFTDWRQVVGNELRGGGMYVVRPDGSRLRRLAGGEGDSTSWQPRS